ncbi:MAG: SufD family Fe-S cluster assembly protein [Coprobacillus sp.]|nr:SufD family Fe-S cluster assembly protein [Coprobacillus sp.]
MPSNNNFVFHSIKDLSSHKGAFNCAIKGSNVEITTAENLELYFILYIDKEVNLHVTVSRDCVLHLGLICKNIVSRVSISGNVGENGELYLYFADFSENKSDFTWSFDLDGANSKGVIKVASVSSHKDIKHYEILINHNNVGTYGLTDCYGVAKDESTLSFIGNGHIFKGKKDSKAVQNCRVMVFDEKAKGVVKPVLQIDDNDIEASHLAILGKINPEQMFYMTSRGLSESIAKELITYGYLNPILNGFNDEECKDNISKLMREKMS